MNIKNLINNYNWSSGTMVCNRVPYVVIDFIYKIVEYGTVTCLAKHLGTSRGTITRAIKKYLPELTTSSTVSLDKRVFKLLEIRRCSKCMDIKLLENFWIDKNDIQGYRGQCKVCSGKYNVDNADLLKERRNPLKLYKKEYDKPHYGANKEIYKRRAREYQMRKIERTPPWADMEKIDEVYETRAKGYHVDHIVPLKGELVSGLHVHYNLQHLTAEDNLNKGNRYDPNT